MKIHTLQSLLLVTPLALLCLASCAQSPPPLAAPAPPANPSAQLALELRTEIGSAACKSTAQCRSLAVGYKACGGPAGYRAWSTTSSDEARLKALAARLAAAERIEQEREGMLSNCQLVTDPGAVCVAAQCQLGRGEGGAGRLLN